MSHSCVQSVAGKVRFDDRELCPSLLLERVLVWKGSLVDLLGIARMKEPATTPAQRDKRRTVLTLCTPARLVCACVTMLSWPILLFQTALYAVAHLVLSLAPNGQNSGVASTAHCRGKALPMP